MGAWDSPHRGYKQFFDLHIAENQSTADRLYLPGHMGWMTLCPSTDDNMNNFQYHILFQENLEYLGAKILAYNYGLSYLDIQMANAKPFAYRNGDILKNYDLLRRSGYFSAKIRQRLRDPDTNFMLQHSGDKWYLTEANYAYALLRPDVREFSYRNPYSKQTPMIRIEHRHQPVEYDSSSGIDLLPLDETEPVRYRTVREFETPVNLSQRLGLGFWVYGDGGGQYINIRLESPSNLVSGFSDHIVVVDFTGWRYFALAEADNGLSNPGEYNNQLYEEYRQPVHYNSISKVQITVKGSTSNLRFRTVRALPLIDTYLVDPVLQMDGKNITFRGQIRSGHFMEYTPGGRAVVYNAVGNEISVMQPDTPLFRLPTGKSAIRFSGADQPGNNRGVRITLRTIKDPAKVKDYPRIPKGLSAIYGQILSDVALPAGWSWVNKTLPVGDVGVQTHKANFTPDDPKAYYAMTNVDLQVTVKAQEIEIPSSSENLTVENPLYAWVSGGLLYVSGLTSGKMLSVFTVTGVLVFQSIAVSNEANIKLKAPGTYIVQSEGRSVKVVFE
jgi:hypothetical protein